MPKNCIDNVRTKPVGFAPILAHYFDKCDIVDIVDEHVPTDPRRKVLTHGQACIAMITGILFQVMQLYRICQFARESTVLDVLLPGIQPQEYFDDRLADTLDALYDFGLDNLETMITGTMIDAFDIRTDICHNDTTCAQMFGDADNRRSDNGITITFGYSKQYRKDLKQLVWSLSASSDSAFPLFQQAYSGNTGDVETYVEQWHRLIDLLGKRDFLFVGDSKVVSRQNMAHIHDHGGFFISPLPMYASYEKAFAELDLLVVNDIVMSETARLAHYVLPCRTFYEAWDATFFPWTYPEVYFQIRQRLSHRPWYPGRPATGCRR